MQTEKENAPSYFQTLGLSVLAEGYLCQIKLLTQKDVSETFSPTTVELTHIYITTR